MKRRQKNEKGSKRSLLLPAALLMFTLSTTQAQVTIGSGMEPAPGALLDLKEKSDGTSTKGLMLPRVALTSLNPSTTSLAASIGSPEAGSWDMVSHTGMMVYNVIGASNRCASPLIPEGVYIWTGTEWHTILDILAPGVMKHPKKEGVYEEFYSADFGAAGRWMTTNLTAWQYDGITHSQGRTLQGPRLNGKYADRIYNTAYWCYPNGGKIGDNTGPNPPQQYGGEDPTSYNANPYMGLLYTWDAATAGKGGAGGASSRIDERGDSLQARIQGICPQGWHLPSDYEWTLLENEIIKHTTRYADVASNIDQGDGSKLLPFTDYYSTWRGVTLGLVMKSPCPLSSRNPGGASMSSLSGGFNVLLAGYVGSLERPDYFGYNVIFWTSSSCPYPGWPMLRQFDSSRNAVSYCHGGGNAQFSVRCKKD